MKKKLPAKVVKPEADKNPAIKKLAKKLNRKK